MILIKNTLKSMKARKLIQKIDVWRLYLIFTFSINIHHVSLFRFYRQTWRIFYEIVLFLQLSKIVGDITKNLIRILRRCLMKEYFCNEVAGFQASALLKVNFSTFPFQNLVNCLGTLISRNAFERLFPPFFSSWNLFVLSRKQKF